MTDSEQTAYSYMSYRVMLAMLDDACNGDEGALYAFHSIPEDEFQALGPEESVEIRNRLKKLRARQEEEIEMRDQLKKLYDQQEKNVEMIGHILMRHGPDIEHSEPERLVSDPLGCVSNPFDELGIEPMGWLIEIKQRGS
jgi:predicted ribosome quality control (RQC) complex YloA/Tae2 family protein